VGAAEELREGVVFRFAWLFPTFPPNAPKASPKHFEFTSEERKLIKQGKPALLSVWDKARTTIAEARAMRSAGTEVIAYLLDVALVCKVEVDSVPRLKVVRDPLPDASPGADGHCGIAGLSKKECSAKDDRYALRVKLADLTFRAEE
jgi:hypothetical protein